MLKRFVVSKTNGKVFSAYNLTFFIACILCGAMKMSTKTRMLCVGRYR